MSGAEREQINLFTRRELNDTLRSLPPASAAHESLVALMALPPTVAHTPDPRHDSFLVNFPLALIEEISLSMEHYSYDAAGDYIESREERENTETDDARFYHWQSLHEKWSMLELAAALAD